MKFKHLLISSLSVFSILIGCIEKQEFLPDNESGIPINLYGGINQISTKVNEDGFEDNDALGLYAVNYENDNNTAGVLKEKGNQADNVKYILTNHEWKPVRSVYYKDANTNVDLYAYYPYVQSVNVEKYNFEVQQDQSSAETNSKLSGYEASDFLWGKTVNVIPTESKIKITLNHIMAGVHVVLEKGDGFEEANDFELLTKKVLVVNTTRKGEIDLTDGSINPIGDPQSTGIIMSPQTDFSFRAVIIPQEIMAETPLFSITIDGIAHNFKLNESCIFQSGKINKFIIKVKRNFQNSGYDLELMSTDILDWTEDIKSNEKVAVQYYCVNCTEPGKLKETIEADNMNPKKIKNLKVTGTITDDDFYFMRDEMSILEAVNLRDCRIVNVELNEYSVPGKVIEKTNWAFEYETYCTREHRVTNDVIPDYAFKNKTTLSKFVFPENITEIGIEAFYGTLLSGALYIPDGVEVICPGAFSKTLIQSLELPKTIIRIDWNIMFSGAFHQCKALTGQLTLPESLEYIGSSTFQDCKFTGSLILPENLQYIGVSAFASCGNFANGLTIPENIKYLLSTTFSNSKFNGTLNLNNVTKLYGDQNFSNCGFHGELIIPDGIIEIPVQEFSFNNFTNVIFPSTIKIVRQGAFWANYRLMGNIVIPEGCIMIEGGSFDECRSIEALDLPSTLQTIEGHAFNNCYGINKIISRSINPPAINEDTFNGVSKDNFTVEVPSGSIRDYQTDPLWKEFKKISSHYDFSISRYLVRALNNGKISKYILQAPANHSWHVDIDNKPEWIDITPNSGTGKTEITITVKPLQSSEGTFTSDLKDNFGNYIGTTTHNGRKGKITFILDGKDYTTFMTVEQYYYSYKDGDVKTLQNANKGNGVNIVFMGDCYDARDIASGTYLTDMETAYKHFFDIEPYSSYKDYFNVYAVFGESNESGMGTVNTIRDAKFGSQYSLEGIIPDSKACYDYAKKANNNIDPTKTLVVLVENTTDYGGICYMWGDGTAIACCPKSADAYPYDFRGVVQHEAGGHGFGKLGDEYIYHNDFISTCSCACCNHANNLIINKNRGWFRNLEITSDINEVGWSHLIFNPDYSDKVDIYEGGYFHTRGVYRSESTSCMNNNIPYFSAISRQAIVERILQYAGEQFTIDKFYENDKDIIGNTGTKAPTENDYESQYKGKQHAPVYVGDKFIQNN